MTNEEAISLNMLDDIITKAIDESDNQVECQTLRWVLDMMSELPSVTPKTVADFADKCKECGEILNEKLQTRWIPVSEGLPKAGQRVLVADKFEAVTTALYFGKSPFWREMVVAWQPLPQPYKVESEDENDDT